MRQDSSRTRDWRKSLLKKYPRLQDMSVVPLDRSGLDMETLSDFIETAWTQDYGDQPRIRFSPDFLRWNMGERLTGVAVLTGQGEPAGVLLYFKRWYQADDGPRSYAIFTGFSVSPAFRKQGIGQMLYLFFKPFLREENLDFGIVWFDIRHSMPGSCYQVFDRRKPAAQRVHEVPILVRILDVGAGVTYLAASAMDRISMRCTARIFPVAQSLSVPRGFVVEGFRAGRTRAYTDLMKICFPENGLVPAEKDFLRWQASETPGSPVRFHALVAGSGPMQGQVMGLFFGRRVRLDREWHYFQADGLLLHPKLSHRTAGAFIRSVEAGLARGNCCMGIAVPGTGCSRGLWRYGYLPATRHYVTVEPIGSPGPDSDGVKSDGFEQGWIELR